MKKLILFISAFLYLTAATGATLHFHYCMGEETGWSLVKDDKKDCGKCGMEKKQAADSGCCKDESKLAQLKIDQSVSASAWDLSSPAVLIHVPFPYPLLNAEWKEVLTKVSINPPPLRATPVYILDRNFRI